MYSGYRGIVRLPTLYRALHDAERGFPLFDGPGGAMGIGFFVVALGLFSRVSAKKNFGVFLVFFLVFFGGVFVLLGFFFVFRALARKNFGFFFLRGAVSKTGNSRSAMMVGLFSGAGGCLPIRPRCRRVYD